MQRRFTLFICLLAVAATLCACHRQAPTADSSRSLEDVLNGQSTVVVNQANESNDANERPSGAGDDRGLPRLVPTEAPRRPIALPPVASELSTTARSIFAAALKCERARQAVIANNLANANTIAFKRQRISFEDTSPTIVSLPGHLDMSGNLPPVGTNLGTGCRVAGIQDDFRQGPIRQTGRDLDIAIDGLGFLQVTDPNETIYFTRAGNLALNSNGALVVGSSATGRLIEPPINIPPNATRVSIDAEGQVLVQLPGQVQLSSIGQMQLAVFVNPEGLVRRGENLFAETDASGAPTVANPGTHGLGKIRQGCLEMANVEVELEMIAFQDCDRQIRRLRQLLGVAQEKN